VDNRENMARLEQRFEYRAGFGIYMHMWIKRWVLLLSGVSLVYLPLWAAQSTQNTRAELVLEHVEIRPGESTRVGVLLRMNEGWHTYWVNPGESGGPTEVRWDLPEGITVDELQWPVPELYVVAGIGTYVYHDEVLLMVPLHVAPSVPEGLYTLNANVQWLECAEVCLPGGAKISAPFRVGASRSVGPEQSLFEQWEKRLPGREPVPGLRAEWEGTGEGNRRSFILEWERRVDGGEVDFFPLPGADYDVTPQGERLERVDGRERLRMQMTRYGEAWPREVAGLVMEGREAERMATEVRLELESGERVTGQDADELGIAGASISLWLMLWFAFVGGMILNLMPCVLPVIALKVMGFLNQVRQSPAEVRMHGLIYGVGVLISFLALAGWGMQFQSPAFLLIMTTLVVLVALNLFGVFEVTLGGRTMDAAAELASRSGSSGAFFHGVLATALATPCTAPFLGAALGFAMVQPPLVVVLMFLMVGAGLALPYVAVSFVPGLARWLPRPGAWMEKFKVAMGFPLAATAFWLLSVLARHFGADGVLWVGVYLVCLALALWVWGQFVQRGTSRRPLAMATSLALLALGYGVALEQQLGWRSPRAQVEANGVMQASGGVSWERWSPEALEAAQAKGRPVLVDFTAAWCVTCLANKKTSIEIPSVRERLREIEAVTLLGDYTLRDDVITEELRRWGRAGVPLVLVYSRDATQPPRVLPELLTPGVVLEALDWAAGG
jgi:thiol:disulfide interchange protein